MPRAHKPDPYKDFRDDRERRLALNYRETCKTIAVALVAFAVAFGAGTVPLAEALRWLRLLAH